MDRPPPSPVTFQISLTPEDLGEARHLLPHQLRQWAGQVAEVLCTVDLPPQRTRASGTHDPLGGLGEFLGEQMLLHPHLRWMEVDYSSNALRRVADALYQGRRVPLHNYRGRPIYAYLYGLMAASHDLVFHIDADMLFGGGSQGWIREAVELLEQRADVITCSPLPGPPRVDGRLLSQEDPPGDVVGAPVVREPHGSPAYRFATFSARLFLLNRRKLASSVGPLRAEWPPLRKVVRPLLHGRRPHERLEQVISRAMIRRRMVRVDFLGADLGMWSIHPVDRSLRFKRLLPELIRRVEEGDVDDSQRGEYDLTEGMLRSTERATATT
jgi:hypothetical protein